MIVGIWDKHIEDHSFPQLPQVFFGWRSAFPQKVSYVQIGAIIIIIRFPKHRHCRSEMNPLSFPSVESLNQESRTIIRERYKLCWGRHKATGHSQFMGHHFPGSGIIFIMLGGKLGYPKISIRIHNRSLGTSTAKWGTRCKQNLQPFSRILVIILNRHRRCFKFTQCCPWRRCQRIIIIQERAV